jgi:hypothetical protein
MTTFAAGAPLPQIADRLGGIAQRERPVDDRGDLASFEEFAQFLQILLVLGRDPGVQSVQGRPWRFRSPDLLYQNIGGNDLTGAQKQKREQCAIPPLPYRTTRAPSRTSTGPRMRYSMPLAAIVALVTSPDQTEDRGGVSAGLAPD